MRTFFRILAPTFLICLASCGKSDKAKLTLVTGLESGNHTENLMERFRGLVQSSTSTCTQTQVFAVWGYHTDNGPSKLLPPIPVGINTPTTDGTLSSINLMGPGKWLASSTLSPVTLSVGTGLIDVGIGGFVVPSTATSVQADGTCPLLNGLVPVQGFSLLGHTTATISGDTTLPVKLYITDAQPLTASGLPVDLGGNCDAQENNDTFSQDCPNLNFRQLFLNGCATGSTGCGAALATGGYLQIQSFISNTNLTPVVNQYVSLATVTGGFGAMIPDLDPFFFTVFDASGHSVATGSFDDSKSSDSSAPVISYFTDNLTYASAASGSGLFPPGNFPVSAKLNATPPTAVIFDMGHSNNATNFKITNTTISAQCNTTPTVITNGIPATVTIGSTCIPALNGQIAQFTVTANSSVGKTTSQTVSVPLPPAIPLIPVANQLAGGTISLSWTTTSGATGYTIMRSADGTNYTPVNQTPVVGTTYEDASFLWTYAVSNFYKVMAIGSDGLTATSAASSPVVPIKSNGTMVATPGTGSCTLSNLSFPGATTMIIKYGTSAGNYPTTATSGTTVAPTYAVTTLTSGTTYYFQVTETNTQSGIFTSTQSLTCTPN